jgi:hypothetical protein
VTSGGSASAGAANASIAAIEATVIDIRLRESWSIKALCLGADIRAAA